MHGELIDTRPFELPGHRHGQNLNILLSYRHAFMPSYGMMLISPRYPFFMARVQKSTQAAISNYNGVKFVKFVQKGVHS